MSFTGPPLKIKPNEHEDSAQHLLFTMDPDNPGMGKIKESRYSERLEKSDTGRPFAKYDLDYLKLITDHKS